MSWLLVMMIDQLGRYRRSQFNTRLKMSLEKDNISKTEVNLPFASRSTVHQNRWEVRTLGAHDPLL